jgi:2-oxoglutarate dehydrogenase E2 component (dihydrolipoamide succinyltransferase)
MVDVKVPSVGESISEVTIASWMKKDGEMVKLDEAICSIESDKATLEISAPKAGKLKILQISVVNKRAAELMQAHRTTSQENKQKFLNYFY